MKQTDLYHEYLQKCREIKVEENSSESSPHYHQQIHRKQRSNLHMYARSGQSWQLLPSPPLKSPNHDQQRSKLRSHSNESLNLSSMEFSTPLNVSIKQDPIDDNETNHLNKSKSSKQQRRRRQMLCKKKLPQNNYRQRRKRLNSVENHGKRFYFLAIEYDFAFIDHRTIREKRFFNNNKFFGKRQ